MRQNLQRLVRELREEKCPQRVVDEVARRLSAQSRRPALRFRPGFAGALAAVLLLCGLAIWRWHAQQETPRQTRLAETSTADSVRIARQAEGALGYIGRILLDAGAHSEKVILEGAVPPLRNGLETTKNKLVNRIEL